jgi:hypothetical protein
MVSRLSGPLGSDEDRDEFQIGRMLIWVRYAPNQTRSLVLSKAKELLPLLESDIPAVEALVTRTIGSEFSDEVAGIMIELDGSASYTCTFFDGKYEGEFIAVKRTSAGEFIVQSRS